MISVNGVALRLLATFYRTPKSLCGFCNFVYFPKLINPEITANVRRNAKIVTYNTQSYV